MEYHDADPSFRARFLEPKFESESFLQSIASKTIGSTELSNMKRRMYLISSEAKNDLKQNVYRNHTKLIETSKQMTALESEVYQLHTLIADEKQLLNTVKELLSVEEKSGTSDALDGDSWESLLRHCQSLSLVASNPDRRLIHSGKLLEVRSENLPTTQHLINDTLNKSSAAYITYPCYGLLFNDYFIIVKSTNIRTATAYDVDQVIKLHRGSTSTNDEKNDEEHKQYTPATSIQLLNVKDDILRNSFAIKYNLETVTLMCDNAQIKKHWNEMFESVLYSNMRRFSIAPAIQTQQEQVLEEEFFSEEWVTNTQEDLIVLLAERNYDQALTLILKARKYSEDFLSEHDQQSIPFVDDFVKSVQEKDQDLCKFIEKEILYISDRGCSTNLLKYYYHHIEILKQLGYIPKAW